MDTHVCKQCGSRFVYCRACVFRPIKYKDLGYCTKECYEASKVKVEQVVEETVEEISIEEVESEVKAPIEVEETASIEVPTETIIKKETNTYKKKKNKYKYTSSY